jgi:hypothetical protein
MSGCHNEENGCAGEEHATSKTLMTESVRLSSTPIYTAEEAVLLAVGHRMYTLVVMLFLLTSMSFISGP